MDNGCYKTLLACIGVSAASKCCIPPQWTATTNFLTTIRHNGKSTTGSGMALMAYDSINGKIGQYEYITIGGKMQLTLGVLLDYNSNTKYMLKEGGNCYKTALNREMSELSGCIPDNVTTIANAETLGLGATPNNIKINAYGRTFEGGQAYIAVTAENCIPVLETITGNLNGHMFLENVQYFNVSGGIANPTDLQVPPMGCENAVMFSGHYTGGNFMSGPVGRRSAFFGF